MAKPVSVKVDTFGTGDERAAADFVMSAFDFRPRAIIEKLDLLRPIYRSDDELRSLRPPGPAVGSRREAGRRRAIRSVAADALEAGLSVRPYSNSCQRR